MDEERRLSGAVKTRYYAVVYDLLEDVETRLQKILSPTPDGELVGASPSGVLLREDGAPETVSRARRSLGIF